MRFVELFAGAGGMGIGLEAAGMEHLLSFEKMEAPHSVLVYAGKLALQMDLADVGNAVIAMRHVPDLIVGGPPCQDFSVQGEQVEGDRARLTQHFAQIVCLKRPEWFLFENVTRAAKSREYQAARALWKRHGYGLTEVAIDCSEYGVPQKRKRFFCIGRLDEIDGFLEREIVAAKSKKPMTVREILDPKIEDDRRLLEAGIFFVQPWRGREGEPNGRGVLSIDEPCLTLSRHSWDDPSSSYIRHPKDAGSIEDAVVLSTSQAARIQGFASDYNFRRKSFENDTDTWSKETVNLMIANAVPAPVTQRIGKIISDRHYGQTTPTLDKGFSTYLRAKLRSSMKKPPTEKALKRLIDNIRSLTNRALSILGGRMHADVRMLIAELESSFENGIPFSELSTGDKSGMRTSLRHYHAYRTDPQASPPSEWAPKTKMPEFRQRFRIPKKPGRPKRKGVAISPSAEHPIVERPRGIVTWPPRYSASALDPEFAQLIDMFDDGSRDDPYDPQPPAGDPDELWRPEGYDDPLQDPDYLEYLESLKDDD